MSFYECSRATAYYLSLVLAFYSVALAHGGRSVLKMPRFFGSATTESPAESSRVFAGTWNMNALDSSQRPRPSFSRSELLFFATLFYFHIFVVAWLSEVEIAE